MRTIHIFDMDDTLLVTPTFAEFLTQGLDPRLTDFVRHAKQAFMLFMSKDIDLITQGDFIILVDAKSRSPLPAHMLSVMKEKLESTLSTMKPEAFKKLYGVKRSSISDLLDILGERDGHIIVLQIRGFHSNPQTIGSVLNPDVAQAYHAAHNKMILTGRNSVLIPDIESRLSALDLEYPNYGLHCYPKDGNGGIKDFKLNVILSSIEQNGWEMVHFYEDNESWLEASEQGVKAKYPDIGFVKHHITNVHSARSL